MVAFISAVGASLLTSLVNFLKNKAVRFGIIFAVFYFLISIIDFKIALPDEVYAVFTSDFLVNFFNSLTFFFPMDFFLKCLAVMFLSNYFGLFVNILKSVYRMIVGGASEN